LNEKKNILIGISGGIAAYKTLSLIRLFVKSGHEVKVAATHNALEFVTPLSIETLSNNSLYCDTFALPLERKVEHISLAQWADIAIVAPATANCIGKLASGIADDALSTLLLAFHKPLFLAPSMNENMYLHFSVQKNLKYLKDNGIHILEPEEGFLACQTEGKGRMAEAQDIYDQIILFLNSETNTKNFRALVTAGPTYESIDAVRFIGNHSSGLMGFSIAEALAEKGISVDLVTGTTHLQTRHPLIRRIDVISAQQMYETCLPLAETADIIVMAAAVADYTPVQKIQKKLKKENKTLSIELKPTVDILKTLATQKKKNQYIVGFALETDHELENAKHKLQTKNLDCIVLNSLHDKGAGFGVPTNKVKLIDSDLSLHEIPLQSKKRVAEEIVKHIMLKINL
jgi:phosphopantothenoylcysteine decarboxylase/phosphopantothenate--cysteine ligase